jgi:acyl-ACP thioesterase
MEHEKQIEVRWRDLDSYGHVNNVVFLTYLEEARDRESGKSRPLTPEERAAFGGD